MDNLKLYVLLHDEESIVLVDGVEDKVNINDVDIDVDVDVDVDVHDVNKEKWQQKQKVQQGEEVDMIHDDVVADDDDRVLQ